jgi:hypothetical protein
VPDTTGQMEGHGFYDQHSLAQHSAGALGLPLLRRAVEAVATLDTEPGPLLIADLGAAGGRNEFAPMAVAIDDLRAHGIDSPIVVVHTDIPTNDFSTLFENLEHDPASYLKAADVFAFAAGRSFYERIFPASSTTLGWSAIAVHWLSEVPTPIVDHVYCAFATGPTREAFARQSAADWQAFLEARTAELRIGGQLVVVGGAATDDGTSGAEALMDALNDALHDAVDNGTITDDEYRQMTVPTWNRTAAEFAAPFQPGDIAAVPGLSLLEQSLAEVPDQYLAAYRASGDADGFADAVTTFLRAFTEPSIVETLDRPPADRAAIADSIYGDVQHRVRAEPESFETVWRVALLRIAKTA